jgi:hypothetical protein
MDNTGALSTSGTLTTTSTTSPQVSASPPSGPAYMRSNRPSSGAGEVGFRLDTAGVPDWYIYESASGTSLNFYGATSGDVAHFASAGGMYMQGATGAIMGAGTINATGLYINGTALNAGIQSTATATLTMTNASCTAANVSVRFVKVGDQVTIRVPNFQCGTFNGTDKVISGSITFPAGMTPAVSQQFPSTMYVNGTNASATLRVPTSGSWQWLQNAASSGTALTSGGTSANGASESTTFTYTLN